MQVEEGTVRIDSIDPEGHEESDEDAPGPAGVRTPGTSPAPGSVGLARKICVECLP